MKIARFLPAGFLLAAGFASNAATVAAPSATAEVIFDHPEKFTDVKDSATPSDKGRDAILGRIRDFIVSQAGDRLPDGYMLTMTFTNIDLAGDFEPWHGPLWDDVRVVKDIYPPAFKFTYTVADPAGRIVKRGSENIRDLNFQMRMIIDPTDPLRYEKDILKDWMRTTLRDLKKS